MRDGAQKKMIGYVENVQRNEATDIGRRKMNEELKQKLLIVYGYLMGLEAPMEIQQPLEELLFPQNFEPKIKGINS